MTDWLHCALPRPTARLRLFCFPHAGGGANAFRSWPNHLPADIELWAVRLPGRETRFAEAPFSDMTQLVPPLARALAPSLDRPFALFGHSLGALVAFELVRHLRRQARLLPVRLFVSARRAPHLASRERPCHALPEPELIDCLVKRYGGIPSALLAEPELLRLYLPMLRADLKLVETYRYVPEASLELPVTAFAGREDRVALPEQVRAWQEVTREELRVHLRPGGHFFSKDSEVELLRILAGELEAS